MKLPNLPSKLALIILRIVTGVIFFTHGAARLYHESVSDFGGFLNSQGFMVGLLLAWIITIGEMIFGTLLAVGYKVRYAVIFHAIVIIAGLFLIHIPQGWFVVGHGNGGAEYSILILGVLLYLYSSERS